MCARTVVLMLLGFRLFCVADAKNTCPLELHPPKVVVRFGDPVTVNCTALEDHEGFGWEAKDGGVEKTQRVKFLIWSVESLKRWEIYPQCYANFERDQCSKQLSVTVYKTPDSVSIRFLDQAGPVKEGSDYQLECEVQNIAPVQNLTVKCYKGNAVVNETTYPDTTLTPVNVSSTLLITPSRGDDGVQYRCVAELDLGPDGPQPPLIVTSEPLNITVHYKPNVVCPDGVEILEGKPLDVTPCRADGAPKPQVTWYRNGDVVNASLPLTRRDVGEYIFRASNTVDNTNQTLNVTVGYAPEFACPDSYKVREYESLSCAAQGYPVPEITWFKGREEVVLPASLTRRDGGQYTLIATNHYGKVNHSLHVEVLSHVQTCPLELHPPKVVVRFGDPVTVNCTASEDHEGIGWEAKDGDVEKTQSVKFLIWSAESLKRWEIYPQCYANFERDQCSKRLSVTVYKTPDSVSIRFLDHAGPVKEGSDYQLECEGQNIAPVQNLTVKWYKGNAVVNETTYPDKTLTPVNVSSTLLITPSRGDDGVQYRCAAELDLGPDGPQPPLIVTSEPLNITVHYKPNVECPDRVEILEGKPLDVTPCRADGAPEPQVTWYRNGDVVNASLPLTRRDVGEYIFRASNTVDNTNQTLNVTVGYAPEFACPDSYKVREYESLNLSCAAQGYPVPEITWFKGREEVVLPASLTRRDGGQYTLIATNHYGKVNHSLHVEVLYKPDITKLSKQIVIRGYSLEINCIAKGNPPPHFQWTFLSKKNVESNGSTLNIYDAIRGDEGNYTCHAWNSVGNSSLVVVVELIEDYLPLFALILALIIMAICLAFASIFSVYYKNTKMGRYSLKDARPCSQNGNVAQNGLQNSLPMKKLAQPTV